MGGADWDSVQLAEVAPDELAIGVDLVATNLVVGWCFGIPADRYAGLRHTNLSPKLKGTQDDLNKAE